MLNDILTLNIYAFVVILVRTGTVFVMMPGLGSQQVNMQARLYFTLATTFLLTPVLAGQLPAMPATPMGLGVLMAGEAFAGLVLGSVTRVLFAAVQVTGTVTSFVSGMANSMIFDPISEQQSAIVAGFMGVIATLLMFVTNLHHVLIQALVDSYSLFRPGFTPNFGDTLQLIATNVALTFRIGVQMATPFLVVAFAYYVGLGLMTRLTPQLPIFFVAMPLQIILALGTLAIVIGSLMLTFLKHVEGGLEPFILL